MFKIFVKSGTSNEVRLDFPSAFTDRSAIFNLDNKTYTAVNGSPIPKIEDYGNGWFRCSITATATSTSSGSTGFSSTKPIAVSTLYLWGASLEQSSYPTSYIPTNGTAITRAAETATGSGDAATFNDSEGVLMAEVKKINETTATSSIVISDGTNVNRVQIALIGGTNVIYGYIQSAGAGGTVITSNVPDFKSTNKVLVKYNTTQVSLWINGFEANTVIGNYTWSNGTLNELSFETGAGSENFYGNTRQLQYFDSALTDAQLETLTSWTSLQEMITSQLYTNY